MKHKLTFWSSVEAGEFMRSLILALEKKGWDVDHKFLISIESYRSVSGFWSRAYLRFSMYIEYPIFLALYCLLHRGSRIMVVTTNTFYAPLVAILFSSRRQKVVHLIWDLFPEALYRDDLGIFRFLPYHLIKCLVWLTFKNANANIFLGNKLFEYAELSFGKIPNGNVIPVGSPSTIFDRGTEDFFVNNFDDIDIIYCGNFGVMHDSSTLLDALDSSELIEPLNINLSFYASGSSYRYFIKNKPTGSKIFKNINTFSPLSHDEWVSRMMKAHISLVTIKSGGENVVMPSKVFSSLAAGQAILAICNSDSDLAQLVREQDCGWVVSPGNVHELLCALREISSCKDIVKSKRLNAYRAGHTVYSSESIAQSWSNMLLKI